PAEALRHMASLVRPNGHVIAHELLDDPSYPYFDPPVPAFAQSLRLVYDALRTRGKHPDVARRFQELATAAGLGAVHQQAMMNADPADASSCIQEQGVGLLLASRRGILEAGLANETE